MGVEDNASVFRTLIDCEELISADSKISIELFPSFLQHMSWELFLTVSNHALNYIFFPLAHFNFNIILEQPNHTLNNQLLNCVLVDLTLWFKFIDDARFSFVSKFVQMVITACHSFETRFICLFWCCNLLVNIESIHLLVEFFLNSCRARVNLFVTLKLINPLTKHLDFEGFLMRFLLHHTFNFESICIDVLILGRHIIYFNDRRRN